MPTFSTLIALLCPFLVATFTLSAHSAGAQGEKAQRLAALPQMASGNAYLEDGKLVVSASRSMFVASATSPTRWRDVRLDDLKVPANQLIRPVGGSADRIYGTASTHDGDRYLYAMTRQEEPSRLLDIPVARAAFAGPAVGAVCTADHADPHLLLTVDGGKTWQRSDLTDDTKQEVTSLAWVNADKLLVGWSDGTVRAIEQRDKKFIKKWTAKVAIGDVFQIVADGEHAWIHHGDRLSRILVRDGTTQMVVRLNDDIVGMALCHGRLLTWDWEEVRVWTLDDQTNQFAVIATIPSPPIALAIPFGADRCLLIAVAGQGMLLDLKVPRLTRQDLVVTTIPTEKSEDDPALVAREQLLRRMVDLAGQIPKDARDAIMREANQKKDLTPIQRGEWAVREMERLVANQEQPE